MGLLQINEIAGHVWDLKLGRRLKEYKIREAEILCNLLQQFEVNDDMDGLIWLNGDNIINVKACTRKFSEVKLKFCSVGILNFKRGKVWNIRLPSKVSFLIWQLVRNHVLTMESLQKKEEWCR